MRTLKNVCIVLGVQSKTSVIWDDRMLMVGRNPLLPASFQARVTRNKGVHSMNASTRTRSFYCTEDIYLLYYHIIPYQYPGCSENCFLNFFIHYIEIKNLPKFCCNAFLVFFVVFCHHCQLPCEENVKLYKNFWHFIVQRGFC